MIDYSRLKGNIPDHVYDELTDVIDIYKINTPLRLTHFIAQCAHESAGFTCIEENLNYSRDALLRTFPKYFSDNNVDPYAHKPIKIASRVYANRMGNGAEDSQDGWMYRGRGYLQITGKINYEKFGVERNLVATRYPLESAAWFWDEHKLNEIADLGSDQNVIAKITKVINGGYNGLEDRQRRFTYYKDLIR